MRSEQLKPSGRVIKKLSPFSLLVIFLFISTGCIPESTAYKPPATQTVAEHYQIGKFVWHILLTQDIAEAKRFYGGLFDWRFRKDESQEQVFHIINRGKVIGSIRADIDNTRGETSAIWLNALSVSDVEESIKIIQQFGGEVFTGSARLPDRGKFAIVSDPQGAALMLLRLLEGDPADTKPLAGDWLWMELWTKNLDKAAKFYKALVAYQVIQEADDQNTGYKRFKQSDVIRAGMVNLPTEQVQPNWLPYIRVKDVRQTVKNAEQLGGRVIVEPDPDAQQGRIAIIADPTGAVLAVQELRNK